MFNRVSVGEGEDMLSDRIIIVNEKLHFLKEQKFLFEEYEIVYLSTGQELFAYVEANKSVNLIVLNVTLPDMDGLQALSELKAAHKDIYVIMMSLNATKEMVVNALRCHADDFWEGPVDAAEFRQKIQTILKERQNPPARSSSREENVDRIKRFIQRNYRLATLDFISKELYLSSKYVSRMFNEKSGLSFRDYKINIKMDKAKELLENTSMNINEVSHLLGYKKPESFMRIFKRVTQKTPKQYRKELGV